MRLPNTNATALRPRSCACGVALLSFSLSLRDVEDLLAERGICVSFQTGAEWATKFGPKFAQQLRQRSRGNFADRWHLDESVPRGTHSSVGAELHER